MMNQNLKNLLSMVVCIQVLTSCLNDKKSRTKAPQIGTTKPALTETVGTGDSGGGNAIDLKMLESYIIDPADLQVVKDLVLPALTNTQRDEKTMSFAGTNKEKSEVDAKQEAIKSVSDFFKIKTWYLAPVSLKSLPKEALGVEFTANELQQIAIQTENEIWIDSRLFDKMSREEQARLIMHEVVMSMYLLNFYTIEDYCSMTKKINFSKPQKPEEEICGTPANRKAFEKIIKTQPKRKLNGNDYNSIREATAFTLKSADQLNEGLWKRKLKGLNFTSLVTHINPEGSNSNSVASTSEQVIKYFQIAKVTNKLPKKCHFSLNSAPTDCKIDFEVIGSGNQTYEKQLKVVISSADQTQKLEYSFMLLRTVYINAETNKSTISLYSNYSGQAAVGDRQLMFEMIMKNDELVEIAIVQTKLAHIEETEKETNGTKEKCKKLYYRTFIPESPIEDNVYVTMGTSESESFLINYKDSLNFPPNENCSLAN